MSNEARGVLVGLVIVDMFCAWIAINKIRVWLTARDAKPVLFDWEKDPHLVDQLNPLFDAETDQRIKALENAILVARAARDENRARAALYAVPDPNVIRLPVSKSSARR